ncbi:MAG: hypothetical protein COA42_18650 [Alteromonadaceae bacterium]|nr:MAG: hypothetical protein COA42_18650 [Alteromonadaceae bacterium]
MKTVFLHGALASLLEAGKIDIDVRSPFEAVRFLCSVLPGFKKEYFSGSYFLKVDGVSAALDRASIKLSFGAAAGLHILPDMSGAKAGGAPGGNSPDASDYENREEENLSALFNGGINTTEQGICVPVIYGRVRRAGSAVISAGIAIEEVNFLGGNFRDAEWLEANEQARAGRGE